MMLCLGSPLHSLKVTCSIRGTVLICIKGSSLNIQFSLLRTISGSRDTACDCGMVQGSGDQLHVSFQTMWDRNWWTNPPSVLLCLLGNFEVCLIQFLSMGLSPIAYSKSAHEWHLRLDSSFSSFISSLIIVLLASSLRSPSWAYILAFPKSKSQDLLLGNATDIVTKHWPSANCSPRTAMALGLY